MGPDFLAAAYKSFPGKQTMCEAKFMRHAKELLDMKGQSQREDRVPCILELLRLAKSHSPLV